MDAASKLRIVNKARACGLWEEPASSFKEDQRLVLRRLGVARTAAVIHAWYRLDFMLRFVTAKKPNPFRLHEAEPPWSVLRDESLSDQQFYDASAWAFVHIMDDLDAPTSEAGQLVRIGCEHLDWFFVRGSEYLSTCSLHGTPVVFDTLATAGST